MDSKKIQEPDCIFGYTDDQITAILGVRLYEFLRWRNGAPGTYCTGTVINGETYSHEPTGCGPHGYITYRQDVERFLLGLPVMDDVENQP